jgi:hypothetical protein
MCLQEKALLGNHQAKRSKEEKTPQAQALGIGRHATASAALMRSVAKRNPKYHEGQEKREK